MKTNCDIAVIGGGLNGLAAAVALGGRHALMPFDVCLITANDPATSASGAVDSRASAITLASRNVLKAIGVWDKIAANAQPMRRIIVTDTRLEAQRRPGLLSFGEDDDGAGPAAWMVENRYLYAALLDEARTSDTIIIAKNTKIDSFEFGGGLAHLAVGDRRVVSAGLVAAADGKRSPARAAAGIDVVGWDYGQSGIVMTVGLGEPHRGRAFEHFLPSGPFAVLPLTGDRASLVWTESHDEAERIIGLDVESLKRELDRRFAGEHGEVTPLSRPQCFPLGLQLAKRFYGPRLALVGDAAHVVHPIAGLGFNLGLRDVAALAQVVVEGARLGLDFGGGATLARYQSWRRADTILVAGVTDALNRLFSNDIAVVRAMRSAGLEAVNRMQSAKFAFIAEAAGIGRAMPNMMAGLPV